MQLKKKKRVVVQNVLPEISGGLFPIKRIIGEKVIVKADVFADGHDEISVFLLYRKENDKNWKEVPMEHSGNDLWTASFVIEEMSDYLYSVKGFVNHFKTWQRDLKKKTDARQDVKIDIIIGCDQIKNVIESAKGKDAGKLKEFIDLIETNAGLPKSISFALNSELAGIMEIYHDKAIVTKYDKDLKITVERNRAVFSSWYEIFPRSSSPEQNRQGTFKDCIDLLPEIAGMGFDILYLPPIHPIGKINRKGKNNSTVSEFSSPGSPWAIGSSIGGHKAIEPSLGTMKDLKSLIKGAGKHGMEIAMDIAFQCAPDHPYVSEHPEWFKKRPDGTIQYAENPPKKYEDIVPFDFETEDRDNLWNELKSIILFWIEKGVKIFRVDNPHTKPFVFWEWLISGIKRDNPDVIFLAEAFTRPKVMYTLAKAGFDQSYTYFTWRNSKQEFTDYLNELTKTEVKEYFRPNFWPNTPDIFPPHLQSGGRPAFIIRLILASTLSSSYGIYGPVFELCVNEAVPGKEEYLNSEKFEIKHWDRNKERNLKVLIAAVNKIRKENKALQRTNNIDFYETDNDNLLFYIKKCDALTNIILVIVNLDPYKTQSGWIKVPINEFGIDSNKKYVVKDLIANNSYTWQGEKNYVKLDPFEMPAHIFLLFK